MKRALAKICAKLGIRLIPNNVYRTPGAAKCGSVMDRLLWSHGEDHMVLLLSTIMESETNRMALVAPVIWAVSDVILQYPEQAGGPDWLEAFKAIDLCALFKSARNQAEMSRRAAIATSLHKILVSRFGRPAGATTSTEAKKPPSVKRATTNSQSDAQPAKPCAAEALADKLAAPVPLELRAETVQRILCSHDRLEVDPTARAVLERLLRFHDEGYVTLLVLTIIESENNENALVAPVIQAVDTVMMRHPSWADQGSAWLEAFDSLPPLLSILDVMSELDLFYETSLGKYLGIVLENKLAKHFKALSRIPPKIKRAQVIGAPRATFAPSHQAHSG